MSDILGNLIRIMIEGYSDSAWMIGDSTEYLRSMKDPHAYQQPEYTGDIYYAPSVLRTSDINTVIF